MCGHTGLDGADSGIVVFRVQLRIKDVRHERNGPLGSTVHVLRADADTIAVLAAVDWSRHFRRVCSIRCAALITLMSPSRPHEDLTGILDHVVDAAGSTLAGAADESLRSLRLRGRGEPPGTGMEPDCTFYVGERARGGLCGSPRWRSGGRRLRGTHRTRSRSRSRDPTPTRARPNATAHGCTRAVARLTVGRGRRAAGTRPCNRGWIAPSGHLAGLEASRDVCEAVEGVRFGTNARRPYARIVRRRQHACGYARQTAYVTPLSNTGDAPASRPAG